MLMQNTRVRANFGGRPFMYAEGQEHRIAADEFHDLIQVKLILFLLS